MKYKNTLKRGSIRYIVFREGDAWYGVGLEFNIVESGGTPQEAFILLSEAIQGYLEAARKIKSRSYILNQSTDPEYEEMWGQLQSKKSSRADFNSNIYTFGRMNTANRTSRSFLPI